MGRLVLLYESQQGMNMARLRVLHWEISYLAHNLELGWVLMLAAQMGKLMENFRYILWEILLVQDLEPWEVLMMAFQM